jgi:hypothetical protein
METTVMENPATWGDLEHTIHDAIQQHHEAQAKGVIGLSLVRTIADAVRDHVTKEINEALWEESMGEDL